MRFFENLFISEATMNRRLLEIHKGALQSDLECSLSFLDSALAKTNLMLSRKNLRSVLDQDEEIDIGVQRAKLEKIIADIQSLRSEAINEERI